MASQRRRRDVQSVSRIQQQEKECIAWVNAHLQRRSMRITNLQSDLSSVVPLMHLLEILENKRLKKMQKYFKLNRQRKCNKFQKLDAMQICLKQIRTRERNDINSVQFDAEVLVSGKEIKPYLALIGRMMINYDIKGNENSEHKTPKERRELLKLTKTELTKRCKKYKLSTRGGKGDLVNRLLQKRSEQATKRKAPSSTIKRRTQHHRIRTSTKSEKKTNTHQKAITTDTITSTTSKIQNEHSDKMDKATKPHAAHSTPSEPMLMDWCNQWLPAHLQITNFTNDWSNGRALLYLSNQALATTHCIKPEQSEQMSPEQLLNNVFRLNETYLQIPQLLANDLMTYVSALRSTIILARIRHICLCGRKIINIGYANGCKCKSCYKVAEKRENMYYCKSEDCTYKEITGSNFVFRKLASMLKQIQQVATQCDNNDEQRRYMYSVYFRLFTGYIAKLPNFRTHVEISQDEYKELQGMFMTFYHKMMNEVKLKIDSMELELAIDIFSEKKNMERKEWVKMNRISLKWHILKEENKSTQEEA
eukprot:857911_1